MMIIMMMRLLETARQSLRQTYEEQDEAVIDDKWLVMELY